MSVSSVTLMMHNLYEFRKHKAQLIHSVDSCEVLNKLVFFSFSNDQLLGHLLQVARKVADERQLSEGYRIGEWC